MLPATLTAVIDASTWMVTGADWQSAVEPYGHTV
jgi:hypothetical protein